MPLIVGYFAFIFALFIAVPACSGPDNAKAAGPAPGSTASLNATELDELQTDEAASDTAAADPRSGEAETPKETSATNSTQTTEDGSFPWMPADGDVISFDVLRQGKDFGTHTISFSGDPAGEMDVTSEVSLSAGLGPIPVFTYKLDTTETWEDGVLVGLEGTTNDDGDDLTVSASVEGERLKIDGSAYTGSADLGILPSSHWHKGMVETGQILSTEDGEILDVSTETIGTESVKAGGEDVQATHYRLNSDIVLDLWYDDQSRLVKLSFTARDQDIEYVLNEMY